MMMVSIGMIFGTKSVSFDSIHFSFWSEFLMGFVLGSCQKFRVKVFWCESKSFPIHHSATSFDFSFWPMDINHALIDEQGRTWMLTCFHTKSVPRTPISIPFVRTKIFLWCILLLWPSWHFEKVKGESFVDLFWRWNWTLVQSSVSSRQTNEGSQSSLGGSDGS